MIARSAALLLAALVAFPSAAQRSWNEEKCVRYGDAWPEALARFGQQGLGDAFLAAHDAFLASGCVSREPVCPRSRQEEDIANAMTIVAMNAGMASSFVPFRCRD
jgi:hypothetical protein